MFINITSSVVRELSTVVENARTSFNRKQYDDESMSRLSTLIPGAQVLHNCHSNEVINDMYLRE